MTVCSVNPRLFIPAMSFRSPFAISRRVWANAATSAMRPVPRNCLAFGGNQRYGMATAVPPVTQDAAGSKGPTAMVFLNMGGPSTTAEVEDFLGRLFVSPKEPACELFVFPCVDDGFTDNIHCYGYRLMPILFHWDDSKHTSDLLSRAGGPQRFRSSTQRSVVVHQSGSGPSINARKCASCWIKCLR